MLALAPVRAPKSRAKALLENEDLFFSSLSMNTHPLDHVTATKDLVVLSA